MVLANRDQFLKVTDYQGLPSDITGTPQLDTCHGIHSIPAFVSVLLLIRTERSARHSARFTSETTEKMSLILASYADIYDRIDYRI
jgi:hypothetical protein